MNLDNCICGICGHRAEMFFVHGYRCKDHKFVAEPSDAIIGDDMILVISKISEDK